MLASAQCAPRSQLDRVAGPRCSFDKDLGTGSLEAIRHVSKFLNIYHRLPPSTDLRGGISPPGPLRPERSSHWIHYLESYYERKTR